MRCTRTRRDIDAVAKDVVVVEDHVAEINADAQFDSAVRRNACVALGDRLLHLDRASHRIDDAGKLHQQAVAGGLDDAAMVLGNFRIEQLAAQRFEAFVRASSSTPISREYPATSAARIAARRRVVVIPSRPPPNGGPKDRICDARDCANARHPAPPRT